MRAACVLVVLLAALVAAKDMAHELDEIENIDSSVFNTDASPIAKSPIEQAAAAVVSARDADVDADTEAVAALASESGDDSTLFSFRAMRHVAAVAGNNVGEKAAATHAAAMRILKGGKSVSADDLFQEINREQQMLAAKRALVTRQKQTIADSEESLARMQRLIGDNKEILAKNEHALRRASDDLLQLISKYQAKLRAGITKEVGGTADTPLGQPVRSRPHQRAAYTKWAPRGQRTVDTTKSKVALAAANAKGVKTVSLVPAANAKETKPAAAAAAKAAAPAAAAAAKKMKFAEAHSEEQEQTEAEDSIAAGEAALESDAEEEKEAAADSEESEESEESDAESEDESEDDAEEESDEEAEDSEASEASEESEDSLLESSADLTMSREAVLPGLAPPPHLYNAEDDSFVL